MKINIEEAKKVNEERRQKVFEHNYQWKNETIDDMFVRIASAIYPDKDSYKYKELLEALTEGYIVPGGRIMRTLGRDDEMGLPYNCYACPSPKDSLDSIYDMKKVVTKLLQKQGGVGIVLSSLRPAGAEIKTSGGKASGLITFMESFNHDVKTIKVGANRRGALLIGCYIDHPDIEDFIDIKINTNRITNANISVFITDDFIKAVESDSTWDLKFNGKIYKTVKARNLFGKIIKANYECGEPGIIFIDKMRRTNNTEYFQPVTCVNACHCGETKVKTIYGEKTFKKLFEEGKDIPVLSYTKDKKFVYRYMRNIRKTRFEKLWKLTLDDGTELKMTKDHKLFLNIENGEIKQVELNKIKIGDSIVSCYEHKANQLGYIRLHSKMDQPLRSHVVAEFKFGERPNYPKEHCHHLDENKSNDIPENIEVLSSEIHNGLRMFGDRNPMKNPETVEKRKRNAPSFKGQNNPRYREDIDDNEICKMIESGLTRKEIAKKFGCCIYTVDKRYNEMKRKEFVCNHKVVEIKETCEYDWVYNGTVDETENYYVCCNKGMILSKNCSEQVLPAYINEDDNFVMGSCNLGSLNIYKICKDFPFDYLENIEHYSGILVEFLDKVIDCAEKQINNLIEIEKDSLIKKVFEGIKQTQIDSRRIGLGFMGLHSAMILKGIKYGNNDECIKFVEEVMESIFKGSYKKSIMLAKEKHSFVKFDYNEYIKTDSYKRMQKYLFKDSPDYKMDFIDYGIRNSQILNVAPTGNTSVFAGCSSGIEPIFDVWGSIRKDSVGTDIVVDSSVIDILSENKNTDHFVSAIDLSLFDQIKIIKTVIKFIESNISKTLNAKKDIDYRTVEMAFYEVLYDEDIKSITFYRDGSRENIISSSRKKIRPEILEGITFKRKYNDVSYFVTLNSDEDSGFPFEILSTCRNSEKINKTLLGCCIALHHAIKNISDIKSLVCMIEQLKTILDDSEHYDEITDRTYSSIWSSLAYMIEEYLKKRNLIADDSKKCPVCGKNTYERKDGCYICSSCFNSKCNI